MLLLIGFGTFVFSWFAIRNNSHILETKNFEIKYGTLTEGLIVTRPIVPYFNVLILGRWLLTCMTLIFLRESFLLQIVVLFLTSLATQLFLLSHRPLSLPSENRLFVSNELLVQAYLYTLISLTDFCESSTHFRQGGGGLVLVALILISVAINIVKFFVLLGINIIKRCCKQK